jgi:hypothetical protein
MIRALHEAAWYGSSAVNIVYSKDSGGNVRVREWFPFHPDTLAYDEWGNLGMRVGAAYSSAGASQQNIGIDSRVHIFTEVERKAIILHKVFTSSPDFNDPWSSDSIYRGVGARDVCWFMWLAKQEVLQDALSFAERYAMGIRIGYYPLGQDAGRDMMEDVLANLANDNSALLPQVGTEKVYDIQVRDIASSGQSGVFMSLLTWLSQKIRESIIGQSHETSVRGEHTSSQTQDSSMDATIRYHGRCLAESLTTEFVVPVCKMLGATDDEAARVRFVFSPEKPRIDRRMLAISEFVRLGGRASEREVREMIGLGEPNEGEPTLVDFGPASSGGQIDTGLSRGLLGS